MTASSSSTSDRAASATPQPQPQPQLQTLLRRAELAAQIERLARTDGSHATAVPGLFIARLSRPVEPTHALHEPALCIIAQGRKRVMLGEDAFVYDADSYLVVSHNLPVAGQVIEATPAAPYLGLRLDIDAGVVTDLMLQMAAPPSAPGPVSRGIFTGEIGLDLLDPVLRLMRLLDAPQDAAVLAPLVVREIFYRLLQGEHGWRLGQYAAANGQSQRIGRAIQWLRARYAEPLRIDALAQHLHMSVSSLHHHFKLVTAMSPLQYQKQLRLQEARRLLFGDHADAAGAAYRVGYESASQFSREYSRMFGAPPARDVRRFREGTLGGTAPGAARRTA